MKLTKVWKACIRQKRIGGSNPPHSAPNTALTFIKVGAFFIPVSRFPLFLACSMGGIDGTTECRLALAAHRRRRCLHRDCLHETIKARTQLPASGPLHLVSAIVISGRILSTVGWLRCHIRRQARRRMSRLPRRASGWCSNRVSATLVRCRRCFR